MAASSVRRPGRVKAQAMVETALAFPLLVLIALGLVQFSLYAYDQNVVTTTAQEAARAAAMAADAQVSAVAGGRVAALLPSSLWGKANIAPPTVVLAASGETVTIAIDGSLSTFFPWFSFRSGPARLVLPLHATVTVLRERFRGGP